MSNIIELTTNHTGKMEGIKSLSTSVLLNPNCQKNQILPGTICSRCYAKNLATMYTTLGARLERNTQELTKRFLRKDDYAYLKTELEKEEIFRFEAFGDLNNEMQLSNYVAICRRFPNIRFALYTKMYELVLKYFSRAKLPSNLNLIISSLSLNTPLDINKFAALGEPGQVKVFTVYTKKFIKEHPELSINCGARSCNTCRLCYLKNSVKFVNEILKSERESAEFIIKLRDPKAKKEALDSIEEIIQKYEM